MQQAMPPGCGSIRIGLDVWEPRPELLTDSTALETELRRLIEKYRLGCRKVFLDQYEGNNAGYELMITLEDSFIVIETWPEGGKAAPVAYIKALIDFCNHSGDHTKEAQSFCDDLLAFVRTAGSQERRQITLHGP